MPEGMIFLKNQKSKKGEKASSIICQLFVIMEIRS